MKAISIKLLCIVLYVTLLQLAAVYFVCNNIEGGYASSCQMNYKLSLLKTTASPKIIVVGGSNTIHGIESKRLSEIIGYRVVNLGFDMHIGIRFCLEILSPYLAKGDIVLVSPEYENFFLDRIYYGNETVAFLTAKKFNSLSDYYLASCQQLSSIIRKIPYIAFKKFYIYDLLEKSVSAEANYDEFGDMKVENTTFSGKMFNEKKIICPQSTFNNIVVKDLLRYQKSANAKGAQFIISYPFIPEDAYKLNKTKINEVHNKLKSAGLKIIAPPSESFAAKIYFYDYIYHLNPIGRIMRTDSIIYGLKKCLNE